MSDTVKIIHNEIMRRIGYQRSVKNKINRYLEIINNRSKKQNQTKKTRPMMYGVEFNFEPGDLTPQRKSFVVNSESKFYISSMMNSLKVTGFRDPAATPDSLSSATVPFGDIGGGFGTGRGGYFDFMWKISDSGTDREWQNTEQPSIFMMSGEISPFHFFDSIEVFGGTEIFIDIIPILSNVSGFPSPTEFSGGVNKYTLTVVFNGSEDV